MREGRRRLRRTSVVQGDGGGTEGTRNLPCVCVCIFVCLFVYLSSQCLFCLPVFLHVFVRLYLSDISILLISGYDHIELPPVNLCFDSLSIFILRSMMYLYKMPCSFGSLRGRPWPVFRPYEAVRSRRAPGHHQVPVPRRLCR